MCGIVCSFNLQKSKEDLRPQILDMSMKLRHRGPDCSGIFACDKAIMAHERLAIVDPESGKQPLISKDRKLVLAVNGEIYNHMEIREKYKDKYDFLTRSDCEVIMALYRDKGEDFMEELNGIYAFALYDVERDVFIIGRDHIGIIPLYQGWDHEGAYYVASERPLGVELVSSEVRHYFYLFKIKNKKKRIQTFIVPRIPNAIW